jgi:hypothetical protein
MSMCAGSWEMVNGPWSIGTDPRVTLQEPSQSGKPKYAAAVPARNWKCGN